MSVPYPYNYSMTADTFYNDQYLVYGWFRDYRYLYIGMSKRGHSRIFSNHHVIGVADKVLPTDEFHFWKSTSRLCRDLEQTLITHYDPIFNSIQNRPKKTTTNFIPTTNGIQCLDCKRLFEEHDITYLGLCISCFGKKQPISS